MAKKNNKQDKRTANIPNFKGGKKQAPAQENNVLTYKNNMTVADVAAGMGKTNAQIIMKLMQAGIFANQNQTIDRETIEYNKQYILQQTAQAMIANQNNSMYSILNLFG